MRSRLRQSPLDLYREWAHPTENMDANIFCPYCHMSGGIQTARGKVKAGISGGKVVALILTEK